MNNGPPAVIVHFTNRKIRDRVYNERRELRNTRVVHVHMKNLKLFTIFPPTLPFYTNILQMK